MNDGPSSPLFDKFIYPACGIIFIAQCQKLCWLSINLLSYDCKFSHIPWMWYSFYSTMSETIIMPSQSYFLKCTYVRTGFAFSWAVPEPCWCDNII